MPVHKLGATRISQKRGDYIRKSTRFEVFCLFCLSLNFLPLTRISAVFAPIALFGCPSNMTQNIHRKTTKTNKTSNEIALKYQWTSETQFGSDRFMI